MFVVRYIPTGIPTGIGASFKSDARYWNFTQKHGGEPPALLPDDLRLLPTNQRKQFRAQSAALWKGDAWMTPPLATSIWVSMPPCAHNYKHTKSHSFCSCLVSAPRLRSTVNNHSRPGVNPDCRQTICQCLVSAPRL